MPRIVHAADLHLDSPLDGLTHYEGAPVAEVRSATRRALEALVDLCLDEQASLLLIAGDLYDGDFRDYSTALFFTGQMARLREANVRVVWLRGNHDAANEITKHLRASDNVIELSHSQPETARFEDLGLAVHGQGYGKREVRHNLAETYPAPLPGLLNFGLLHTALDGRPGHQPYAPCALRQLQGHGYDYWALGHVHQREVLSREPWVVFPGNLQGRHVRETGPKGVQLIEVEHGAITHVEFRVLDIVRWQVAQVDAGSSAGMLEVLDEAATVIDSLREAVAPRVLAVRVVINGRSAAHGELMNRMTHVESELRAHCIQRGGIYLERVVISTQGRISEEAWSQRQDALGDLFRSVSSLRGDTHALANLEQQALAELKGQAAELLREEDMDFSTVLEDARRLLEGRIIDAPDGGETT